MRDIAGRLDWNEDDLYHRYSGFNAINIEARPWTSGDTSELTRLEQSGPCHRDSRETLIECSQT